MAVSGWVAAVGITCIADAITTSRLAGEESSRALDPGSRREAARVRRAGTLHKNAVPEPDHPLTRRFAPTSSAAEGGRG